MSLPKIGPGAGNPSPVKKFLNCKAGAAISRGEQVCISGTADDGYTVVLTDADAAATAIGIGIAKNDIASGAWGLVQTGGFCDYIITDGNVAAGQVLISDATAGATTGGAFGTASNLVIGQALADDASTLLTAAVLFSKF